VSGGRRTHCPRKECALEKRTRSDFGQREGDLKGGVKTTGTGNAAKEKTAAREKGNASEKKKGQKGKTQGGRRKEGLTNQGRKGRPV